MRGREVGSAGGEARRRGGVRRGRTAGVGAGSGASEVGEFGAFALGFSHRFDVGPEVGEGGGDLFVAGCEMLVQGLFARRQSVVEMQGLDLQRETALYVLEAEIAGCGMAGLDDVEEVGVGVGVEECKVGGLTPCVDEVGVEVDGRIAFDRGEGRRVREVEVVFYGGEEGQEILFKLEADEFFRAHVAHRFGPGGVAFVPGVVDGGAQKVYPAPVGRR